MKGNIVMNKVIEEIKSHIIPAKDGYSLIKKQDIFVPFSEIGIECLVRNISEINLFFEMILKLVDIGVKDVYRISEILGISFDVSKEIIADIVVNDYINVSENLLKLTKKGKEILKTRKKVVLKNININKIKIDLITGQIFDGDDVKTSTIKKGDVCLDSEMQVDKKFLDTNYADINEVFKKQQEEDSVYGNAAVTKELFKIIDIRYSNLVYEKKYLLVYQNDNSGELQLNISQDTNDQYLNCLYSQLKSGIHPCLDNFFERNNDFIKQKLDFEFQTSESRKKTTNIAISELLSRGYTQEKFLPLFETDRYALHENEYQDFLLHDKRLLYDKLVIVTNRISSILTSSVLEQISRIAKNKKVILIFDDDEYNAVNQVNHFLKDKSKNIFISHNKNIDSTKIIFFPYAMFSIEEYIIETFQKYISYKVSTVRFNLSKEDNEIKELFRTHKIDECEEDNSANGN